MASIHKYDNTQYWIAAFTDEQGKRKRRSTKIKNLEKNRRKALQIAEAYEEVARKQKSALAVKATLSDLLKETGLGIGEELLSCSVKEFAEKFVSLKSTDVGASSISHYETSFRNLCEWLGDRADSPMEAITPMELLEFRKHAIENYSPATAKRKIKAVKALFKKALELNYSLINPAESLQVEVKSKGEEKAEKRPFTIEEIKLMLNNATDEWRSMIYFGIYTGQRLGDLATLRWSNLDLENKIFRISTNKTGRKIQIPFSDTLLEHILTLDAPDDPQAFVHPNLSEQYTSSTMGANGLSNQFSTLLANIGLREPVSHRSKGVGREGRRKTEAIGFHNLRVTAVTLLHEAGIPQATVQEWVGHDSKEVHRLYVKIGQEAAKQASDALPRI